MYLSEVQVLNFRNLSNLRLELQAGLNVLVGRNGVGKTNLLEAIRLAIGPQSWRNEPVWIEEDDFTSRAGKRQVMKISLCFKGLSSAQETAFFDILEYNEGPTAPPCARLHLEGEWDERRERPLVRRWGGPLKGERYATSQELVDQIAVTFLPALRDAETALTEGPRSQLAVLLRALAARRTASETDSITAIFREANGRLETQQLIIDTQAGVRKRTAAMAGVDHRDVSIRAGKPDFWKILKSVNLGLTDGELTDLGTSGLGYSNVVYVAAVLTHLDALNPTDVPLLLVEEPEAHLHPQLTTLLGTVLERGLDGKEVPQTIVSTHSPSLLANTPPSRVIVMFRQFEGGKEITKANSLARLGLSTSQERQLRRMLDVTKAALFFARGAVLVEGVCEALLLPVLALRLGIDLAQLHVSVIPICGVAFGVFTRICAENALGIPIAYVTDGDPKIVRGETWRGDTPTTEGGGFATCPRVAKLRTQTEDSATATLKVSRITLEYELAAASEAENLPVLREALGALGSVNEADIEGVTSALSFWRLACRGPGRDAKAELAHVLAELLSERRGENWLRPFRVPAYIEEAIRFVASSTPRPAGA